MAEWTATIEGRFRATIDVEADTEEEAQAAADAQGCEISDVDELTDFECTEVVFFQ